MSVSGQIHLVAHVCVAETARPTFTSVAMAWSCSRDLRVRDDLTS